MKKCWERINFELERLKYVLFLNKHQYKNNCNERQNKKKNRVEVKVQNKKYWLRMEDSYIHKNRCRCNKKKVSLIE